MNVKKFLQLIHSKNGGDGGSEDGRKTSRLLPPDLQLECGDFILQICDDPFEVKLRANYEVCVCEARISINVTVHIWQNNRLEC